MSVDRVNANNVPQPDAGRLDASQAARRSAQAAEDQTASAAPAQGKPAADTVELSAASKSLVEQAGDTGDVPPSGTLSAERLKTVLDRVESNFYDRANVRNEIASRVAKDLGPSRSE
jgi:hypothetical protein